jgi:hypothetical protein
MYTIEDRLHQLANDCLTKYGEDAWIIYRDEVLAQWVDEHGDREAYLEAATEIFNEEKVAA